jgi:hypothetical protein
LTVLPSTATGLKAPKSAVEFEKCWRNCKKDLNVWATVLQVALHVSISFAPYASHCCRRWVVRRSRSSCATTSKKTFWWQL